MLELITTFFLTGVVTLTIFDIYTSASHLSQQSNQLIDLLDRMRLITVILRQKIHAAGNWSCVMHAPESSDPVIQVLNSDDAQKKWKVHILPNTQALQLSECERIHDHQQYVPILFFVSDTKRVNSANQNIFSLYYKADGLPSEELISDVNQFHVVATSSGVQIDYVLVSSEHLFQYPKRYYFEKQWITPDDGRLYQSGVLYAVKRTTASYE